MQIATFSFLILAVAGQETTSPVGEWLTEGREAQIAIKYCGASLCGAISHSKDGVNVGKAILVDMKPEEGRWKGTVIDPRTNMHYVAYIGLENPHTLEVRGCVLGGLLCGNQKWTRVR